ncbi:hypothetical protein SGQ44_11775 [Flavobacterium sp. Fl-77]|uniref:Uncharacterized protein n=1 Tax=Flavobacterium flavipigmentatum TaxID=2893884 RepID=A0AAJ2SHR0_9FLAO|nr:MULTISPECIES: hypothetical protein [unclassified Flavobacterium]MDX6182991.1 hypothetical protein [Flavobacterium sp. Fl-33]MDX6186444.1 hypothetical protein [Flavobacterium sp. Fl-77]UFH37770.1 hypothetical protein LNP22_13625 [Flavobacterium sp. F-70]
MDIETFRKRFVHYSDEELILMLTKNASKYNPDALVVANEILIDRNVDIRTILKEEAESEPKIELDEDEIERSYIQSLSSIEQIEYLSEKRAEFEENIEEIVEKNNENLTDEELIQNFETILDTVMKTGDFGDITDIHSRENYFITSNIIEKRNLKLSYVIMIKVDFVNMIAMRDFRKRFNKQIFYGLLLLTLGLIFTIGTGGNIIMYGAILSGLGLLVAGIRGKIFIKKQFKELSEAYS